MENKETKYSETEEKIIEAAQQVFIEKGSDGARMKEIAEKAGINKALLHYYFRTKDKLFEGIFKQIFRRFIPKIQETLNSEELDLFGKIEFFCQSYTNLLMKNPMIPMFILREINKNPERLAKIIKNVGIVPEIFISQVADAVKASRIISISPYQLIVNLISLAVFPIAARPLLERVLFNGDSKLYDKFLEERKKENAEFIINAIKSK